MYEVDDKDKVVELKNLPQSSVGAPIPMVLAGEHSLLLAFYLQNTPEDWDGTSVRMVEMETEGEPVAIIYFTNCYAHMFGPPNDESFNGHPLSNRGLRPYSFYKIENSSWLRKLENMNSVHPYHNKENFMEGRNHYIFSFHDSTFECIAKDFHIRTAKGSIKSMVPTMLESLE